MLALVGLGLAGQFWSALVLIMVWALLASAGMPLRQAYVNGLIPSQQRATILSFDSLMASTGGVVTQPALGRVADVWGYPASFLVSSALSACALPFLVKARTDAAGRALSRAGGGAGRARRRAPRAVSPNIATAASGAPVTASRHAGAGGESSRGRARADLVRTVRRARRRHWSRRCCSFPPFPRWYWFRLHWSPPALPTVTMAAVARSDTQPLFDRGPRRSAPSRAW